MLRSLQSASGPVELDPRSPGKKKSRPKVPQRLSATAPNKTLQGRQDVAKKFCSLWRFWLSLSRRHAAVFYKSDTRKKEPRPRRWPMARCSTSNFHVINLSH
jgi:hypothetical protein